MNASTHQGNLLPPEVAEAVQQCRAKTILQPELAALHALALDRALNQLGFSNGPITVSLAGQAIGHYQGHHTATRQHESRALYDASVLAESGSWGKAAGKAFERCMGAEIPALNLIFANALRASEQLWLYFLNKYLAHQARGSAPANVLALDEGQSDRLFRVHGRVGGERITDGPLISVIMPAFNAERTLDFAAQSILGQSWSNLELLIVNDCSTDNTADVAAKLTAFDSRVRVFDLSQNSGPYVAKNLALTRATGAFITVHDADDWAFPDRLKVQIEPLLGHQSQSLGEAPRVSMAKMLRLSADGIFTRFQPTGWVTQDGVLRLCFPSPMFCTRYFKERLGAWDSARFGADLEMVQRIKRFDSRNLAVLDDIVMLQLDSPTGITRAEETFSDERGESKARGQYRQNWVSRHSSALEMPLMQYPQVTGGYADTGYGAPNDTTIQTVHPMGQQPQ